MTRNLSMKTLIVALAAAGLLAGPLVADARGKGGGHHGPKMEQLIEQLDLDESTRASAFEIIDASRSAQRAVHAEKREAREQLRELMDQEQPDVTLVMAQVDVLGEIETRSKKLKIGDMLAINALLSPEQRAQLREMRAKKHRRGGRHGKKHWRGDAAPDETEQNQDL